MREILFKAKRTDNGEWAEGYYCKRKTGYYDNIGFHEEYKDCIIVSFLDGGITWVEVDPETLCQHTGLTDKNGKKIWENDIVANKWCFVCGNSVVKFGEYKDYHMRENYQCGNLGFYLEHTHNSDKNCRKDMMYFAGKCEVLGNIFDNPELLGGDSANGN